MGLAGDSARSHHAASGIVTLLIALVALGSAPNSRAAPYEPNDSSLGASGPLTLGQTFAAALETASDRDFFYFYVTSAGTPQVELTLTNSGGGENGSDIDIAILDASLSPIAAQAYIVKGETRATSIALKPGKYFAEVAVNQGFGDSYSLTPGGGVGAFGTYDQIAGRCSRAMAAASAARRGLDRAEAKLQRATARLRRSRYAPRAAREGARAAYGKAKVRVRSKRLALRAAAGSREPWCAIPQ
jgi:hypothetical protein